MKMDDYIDREAAIETVSTMALVVDERLMIIRRINALPSADVKPVVFCKDCKHRDPEDGKCDNGHTIIWQLARPDEWYCADGERRSNDNGGI